MLLHANAKLGLAGRLALVRAVEDGSSLREAAASFGVSPATAHRWWHRWRDSSEEARRSLSCLLDRSSRPLRSPRQLAPELAERICACPCNVGSVADVFCTDPPTKTNAAIAQRSPV